MGRIIWFSLRRWFFAREKEKYAEMQKFVYSRGESGDDRWLKDVVGHFEEQETYPYEQYLLKYLQDPSSKIALDFGCGPGRMILRMAKLMKRVDGVDISPSIIEGCRRWAGKLPNPPRLYVNDGLTLKGIPSQSYDLVFCTISFHHIARYDVRFGLLQEFFRVLKPGGKIALQMIYTNQPRKKWLKHYDWLDNPPNVMGTNSAHDVRITDKNLPLVSKTFARVGFTHCSHALAPPPHAVDDATHWIFLYANKPEQVNNPEGETNVITKD